MWCKPNSHSDFHRSLIGFAIVLVLFQSLGATLVLACTENAMLVFDASGSMTAFQDGRSKIGVARRATADVLPDITRTRPTGLITYGGGTGPDCSDYVMRVAPARHTGARILSELFQIVPAGATPLSDGVAMAVATLRRRSEQGIVVLITDGIENCGRPTCRLADRLVAQGSRIRLHVITFFLRDWRTDTLRCLTDATDGTYATTDSLETLRAALRRVLGCRRLSQWQDVGTGHNEVVP